MSEAKARRIDGVRADGTAETRQRRLNVYDAETKPLLVYRERGLLKALNGMAPIESVAQLAERMHRGRSTLKGAPAGTKRRAVRSAVHPASAARAFRNFLDEA